MNAEPEKSSIWATLVRSRPVATPASGEAAVGPEAGFRAIVERISDVEFSLPLQVTNWSSRPPAPDNPLGLPAPSDGEGGGAGPSLVTTIEAEGGVIGAAVLSAQLVAMLIEVQTLGVAHGAPVTERAATPTDLMLAAPFLNAMLAALTTGLPQDCSGWAGATAGRLIPDPTRLAALLDDRPRGLWTSELVLSRSERAASITLLLPEPVGQAQPTLAEAPSQAGDNWTGAMAEAVLGADQTVIAVLHRENLSLDMLEGFEVGQIITLTGAGLDDLRLETSERELIATGRLGQSSGVKAIRIGPRPAREMGSVSLGRGAAGQPDRKPPVSGRIGGTVQPVPDPAVVSDDIPPEAVAVSDTG